METATAHISRRCRPFIASAIVVSSLVLSISANAGSEQARAQFSQTRTVAHRHAVRPGYGWPVKPFNRQHPVRAYLNDPRNGHHDAKSFHFGVDITAPTGSPVYAVEGGEVYIRRGREAVAVRGKVNTFGYWHVKPAVRNHQIVRLHQLLGYIVDEGGGAHVHFAERDRTHDRYLNPLRPGALGPYVDRTPPTVLSIEFLRNGREVDANALSGRIDIVAEVVDTTPITVPEPWSDLPVTAAEIHWGIPDVVAKRTVINYDHMLPGKVYDAIFAPGTSQNWVGQPGHYRYYLAHGFRASRLPAGTSRLRIVASDTRGNRSVASVSIARTGE
jgi:murein DD-endopeptidase MepM/ murein hydrolase activator NlpD